VIAKSKRARSTIQRHSRVARNLSAACILYVYIEIALLNNLPVPLLSLHLRLQYFQ